MPSSRCRHTSSDSRWLLGTQSRSKLLPEAAWTTAGSAAAPLEVGPLISVSHAGDGVAAACSRDAAPLAAVGRHLGGSGPCAHHAPWDGRVPPSPHCCHAAADWHSMLLSIPVEETQCLRQLTGCAFMQLHSRWLQSLHHTRPGRLTRACTQAMPPMAATDDHLR